MQPPGDEAAVLRLCTLIGGIWVGTQARPRTLVSTCSPSLLKDSPLMGITAAGADRNARPPRHQSPTGESLDIQAKAFLQAVRP